jgi:hypothetical protein
MSKPGSTASSGERKPERSLARLSERKSFLRAEEKAREILREKGFSEAQIEIELRRVKRSQLDE